MGKIKKTANARHNVTVSPMITEFVKATSSIPLFQLPAHLASFPRLWPFPRGDLFHWILALNRFDRILDLFNQEYELASGPQTQPFQRRLLLKGDTDEEGKLISEQTPTGAILDELRFSEEGDRELVEQILSFTRLLVEQCGNRSLYASSSHLNNLLNTTSISLLKTTLRLSHRLAQRYHASRSRMPPASMHNNLLTGHYNINLEKVNKLAAPLPKSPSTALALNTPSVKGKEKVAVDRKGKSEKINPADLVSLVKDDISESVLSDEWGGVVLSYYEPSPVAVDGASKSAVPETPASPTMPKTPTPARRTSNLGPNQTPRPHRTLSSDESPTTATLAGNRDHEYARHSGPKLFELSPSKVASTPAHELVSAGLKEVPESSQYELLHRIRVAKAMTSEKSSRADLVAIRLLAVANVAYVYSEPNFQQKIGQQDSDEPRRLQLAYQLSELVHPPGNGESGVSRELQTHALNALEALTKHKIKSGDVCSALSVNVNHGVLFYVVRKAVAELAVEETPGEPSDEDDWREALFGLLNSLPNSQLRTGEAMVSAGLLEILVEVLTLRTNKAERNHPKVLGFLDTFVYNLRDAFQAMVNAKGLEIIADLASYEVESSKARAEQGDGMPSNFKTQLTDYQIPYHQQQTLRWLFKFMNHMMGHTGGNFDRLLRNLIDSPQLLRALRTVISNASTYGSTVWSMAVSILTSFIHNEPTSYQVIAEAGLSKAFLESVTNKTIVEKEEQVSADEDRAGSDETTPLPESLRSSTNPAFIPKPALVFFPPRDGPLAQGILPVAEAISNIPSAFGAICLAEAGMKLFKSSDALASYFEVFESPAHVKALDGDPDVSTIIGNAFDELVRHHPALKNDVLDSVYQMVIRVTTLCYNKAAEEGAGAKLWINDKDGRIVVSGGRRALKGQQGPLHSALHGDDVNMTDADEADAGDSSLDKDATFDQVSDAEDAKDNPSASKYIAVVCKFLGGFFSNISLCQSFIEKGGLEFALDFATLPCLPYKFNDPTGSSEEVSRVIQLLVEQKPHLALPSLLQRAQKAVDQLEPLMKHSSEEAFFAPFTKSPLTSEFASSATRQDVLDHGTGYAKALVTVQTLCNALSLTFQSQIYNHRSTNNIFSQVNLADMYARLIESLGRLHRSCVWEEILLQNQMPSDWEKATRIKSSGFGTDEADDVLRISHDRTPSFSTETTTGFADGQIASTNDSNHSEGTADSAAPRRDRDSAQFKNTQILRYLLSSVPTAITPFFSSLGKLLLFRRGIEPYPKQGHVIVADQLAKAGMDQLLFDVPTNAESARDRYAYWIVILTDVSQLFIDTGMERGYPQALTLVLQCFKNQGGFAVLGDILESFYDEATSIIATQGDDKPKDDVQGALNLSLGGVKIILAFYHQIINSKLINEASQTAAMQSRPDKDRDKPDYFFPNQFVVELRAAVIKPVQKIWNSDLMDKATTSIVKTLVAILKTVLDGDTENGAYKRSDKLPTRSKIPLRVYKVRPESVQRLKDSGFTEELAIEALYRCFDEATKAREYCAAHATDLRASRNPLPYYEVKKESSSSPVRAAVVVPEPMDDSSTSVDSEAPDTNSVTMEDVADYSKQTPSAAGATSTIEPAGSHPVTGSEWDGPYLVLKLSDREDTKPVPVVTVDDLDSERATLRKNLIDRSLDVLNVHDNVTFELSDLISAAVSKATEPTALRGEIGSTLVQSLISMQTGDDFRDNSKKIAASAHLLALVLQEKDFYDATVEELKDSFSILLEFIKIPPSQSTEESAPWIGQVLLIIERLLAEDAQPHQIQWTPPSSDNPSEDTSIVKLPEPVVTLDEKNQMFDAIMQVLPQIGKDESLALSVSRVLVMLTRTRKIAVRLGEKRNIQRLFLMVRQLAGITNDGLRSAFMLILRHIIEDEAIIRQVMRSEIQSAFESRDRRATDTTAYVRSMYQLILRDPETFVEVTNEKLTIPRYEPNQTPQTLALKKEATALPTADNAGPASAEINENSASSDAEKIKPSTEVKSGEGLERTRTQDLKPPIVENPDGVIHYMLCELLTYKDVDDKEPPVQFSDDKAKKSTTTDVAMANGESSSSAPAASTPVTESKKADKTEFKAEAHPIYIYRCFILQCLTELLASYNRTKIEFINFSRKADPHAMTPSKPRSGVLNYLLNALVPVGTLSHGEDLAFKKRSATSSCAINVVVALCVKTGENGIAKALQPSPYVEDETDLLFVRKFVLEHAIKAFKDACTSEEPLDMKYSRLLAISDIFSKMILSRLDNGGSTNALSPTQKQLAKIMYEKNFISTLTTSIADIDLNFPNAKRVVKYILRPLKFLTEIAVDLSTLYEDSSTPGNTEEDEISTASDVSDIETDREETPDLFRNSTLGMFEPGQNMESESDTSDDEDDDEIYDDQYADDMEYDEEMGQDDEDVISEEDEEMDGMGPLEGLSGEMPMDVEVVIGEEGDDDLSEDEDGSEDDEDDDPDDNDIEDMEEVTGDDENASLGGGEEDDWASEDEDHDHDGFLGPDDDADHDHQSSINQIIQVIGERGGPDLIDQLQGDMAMEMAAEEFMEEDMPDEDDEDDEEEEYDEEDIIYNPEGEDDEDNGVPDLGWGFEPTPHPPRGHAHRLNPWMFGGGDRIMVPTYRSHRPGTAPRGNDDGVNPLLSRAGRSGPGGHFGGPRPESMSDWVHAIDPIRPGRIFGGDSPVSFISNLLNAMNQGTVHHHNGAFHLSIGNLPMGLPPPIDPGFSRNMRRPQEQHTRASREDPSLAISFIRAGTMTRWQEEARMIFGNNVTDKSQRVVKSILRLLVPPALEAAKRSKEELAAKQKKEKEEKEAREKKEREEREAAEAEAKAAADAEEAAAAAAAAAAETTEQPADESGEVEQASATAVEGQAMEGVEATQPGPAAEATEAGPAEPTPRITTTIRGRELDITGMGIDMEYLDALPEDIREEVLMQQVQEQRSQAAAAGEEPTDISREFLEALPPDIREELLQQEAAERRRREREEQRRRAPAGAAAARGEDMDTASFLASLEPGLRHAVLMDQDEDMLAQLPAEFAIEARALGGDRRLNQLDAYNTQMRRARGLGLDRGHVDEQGQKRKARPCVQMLDKAGVATLLRLMFIPQTGSSKQSLNSVLKSVCENRQNRAEVISILLSILQDGSADINAVERSFTQLSLRAKQPASQKTPQPLKRSLTGQFPTGTEVSPLMVVQQCLNTLVYLTGTNPHISNFFLSEHETAVGFKSRANRKGKAKETKATKYPLNALLSLLDRKLIIESSTIMEQLATLLCSITQPLQALLKKEKEKPAEEKKDGDNEDEIQATPDQATTSAQPGTGTSGDTEMTSAPNVVQPIQATAEGETSTSEPQAPAAEAADAEDKAKKARALVPPDVPDYNLRLVAKILAARECSSKTFKDTLSVINNLSPIPGAKEVFGKELIDIAQSLGQSILRDLEDLTAQISKAESPTDVQGMALSNFSPASSDQAKLLRVLTALDYLFDPKRAEIQDKPSSSGVEALESSQKDDILTTLYENSTFGPLWNKLSECLAAIRRRGNMLNIATILLPLIEVLMVVCKNTTLKDAPLGKMHAKEFALSSPPPESKMETLFFTFTEDHRKILNDLVRQNPKLMSGSFSLLVKNSKVLEFDNKRNYFNRRLHSRGTEARHSHSALQLQVRRDQVFLDSFKSLYYKSADEMKYGKLSIRFHGEEGVDAGGVTREWFQVLSRQMFNPDYALFVPVASDRTTFHPNRLSAINPEHALFFKFIGRIIGKALYEGRVLDCHFSRAVYKKILGKSVNLKDMETLDLEYYKSLLWMLENDITDIITETFSIDIDQFGEVQTVDLIEDGRNIPVTEDNKHEYVRLVTEQRLTGSVQEQLEHFLKGFHDIVPAELISIFSEQELELLISGLPDINVDDWKNNTEYHNYTAASPQIQWFWRAMRSFDKEERAKLLQFVTGTSKVPLNGFKELEGMNGFSRFNIHRDYGSKDRLPSSHTCFNQLDLPEYETYEALRQQLYTAMTAGSEYFGFA
ncbi:uncharacterized protein BDZ99DRAFT_91844 [Mytilinidion resinicola]|uniref:HECT-type E3 ubiquitin transferase n=1 Tax=Mytilinidion resinicola TaxID=574789 RepID=A0A6A6YEC3_9PEZI|nr:uncharacterized protein BDZ99DRAFT_91844 [Mytilinidion resinicola]KAF2806197.1 hypothetical protein BDZ99DRAFT_91844 [Mytilinidion resinicola]